MTIRFFILQAHYRSTVDFSNEALQASEKGLARLMEGILNLEKITPSPQSTIDVGTIESNCYKAINDDINTPIVIAHLFDAIKLINSILSGKENINQLDLDKLKQLFATFAFDILGLKPTKQSTQNNSEPFEKAVDLLLEMRSKAKDNKDWGLSDLIRDKLNEFGFEVKDTKEGFEWKLK